MIFFPEACFTIIQSHPIIAQSVFRYQLNHYLANIEKLEADVFPANLKVSETQTNHCLLFRHWAKIMSGTHQQKVPLDH